METQLNSDHPSLAEAHAPAAERLHVKPAVPASKPGLPVFNGRGGLVPRLDSLNDKSVLDAAGEKV